MTVPLPPLWVFDVECYSNYFLLMVRNALAPAGTPGAAAHVVYERFNDQVLANAAMPAGTLVSFNGNNYDVPLISLACNGANNITLKRASDAVIVRGVKPWDLEEQFGFERMTLDHIDLIEVAPGQASLKIYGGRLHSQRMQDLPIEPDAIITDAQRLELQRYCGNDLLTTIDLYRKLEPQIALRVEMSREFGIDLRSKSDAQIAEAVIRAEVEKRLGRRVYRPDISLDYTFKYTPPPWVHFHTPGMRQVLDIICAQEFSLHKVDTREHKRGSVKMPDQLHGLRIRIGRGVYRMGIGGLHSSESCVRHAASDQVLLLDRDVTSYYPRLIINAGIAPPALGAEFQPVYQQIVERRVAAKRAGNDVMAGGLKIAANGTFGKLASIYSVMYAPNQMIAVTITGQLALLMLIEMLEECGIEVISANTDGVTSKVRVEQREMFNAIVTAWEMQTGFGTEEDEYLSHNAKDVNNYIAVKKNGKVKAKGLYATEGISKNVTNAVCIQAVTDYVTRAVPIEHTVHACTDVRSFLTIRHVKGGAVYDGQFLGKAVRWYYAQGETRHIAYKTNGNKVARSEGARPLMELPTTLPLDIDRAWYVQEAQSILRDIGL